MNSILRLELMKHSKKYVLKVKRSKRLQEMAARNILKEICIFKIILRKISARSVRKVPRLLVLPRILSAALPMISAHTI